MAVLVVTDEKIDAGSARLSLSAYVAQYGNGNRETAAALRREWRRARPQGMKVQRGTSSTPRSRGLGDRIKGFFFRPRTLLQRLAGRP